MINPRVANFDADGQPIHSASYRPPSLSPFPPRIRLLWSGPLDQGEDVHMRSYVRHMYAHTWSPSCLTIGSTRSTRPNRPPRGQIRSISVAMIDRSLSNSRDTLKQSRAAGERDGSWRHGGAISLRRRRSSPGSLRSLAGYGSVAARLRGDEVRDGGPVQRGPGSANLGFHPRQQRRTAPRWPGRPCGRPRR